MNIKKFYEEIGGDYNEALTRLMNDALIEKFVLKFKETQSIEPLKQAISAHDYEQAFFHVHTLKGVSLNLSFKKLGAAASELTEMLRGDLAKTANETEVNNSYKKIEETFFDLIGKIN